MNLLKAVIIYRIYNLVGKGKLFVNDRSDHQIPSLYSIFVFDIVSHIFSAVCQD